MKIKKAVFPVAGFGTRMLPASKTIPKEMITLIDKPLIHYAVKEAIEAGIEQIIFVTGRTKKTLEDYFDRNIELENTLKSSGKTEILEEMNQISNMCDMIIVRQKEPKGLGHAIYCAASVIGDEPFAVMLPDDIMYYENKPVIGQLIEQYEETGKSCIALKKVSSNETNLYGIASVEKEIGKGLYLLKDMVEKPKENPPSDLAIMGRYILTPDVMKSLSTIKPGSGGEFQLTDAIKEVTYNSKVYGYLYDGVRFDCGNKFGYLEATIHFAMKRNDLKDKMRNLINKYK